MGRYFFTIIVALLIPTLCLAEESLGEGFAADGSLRYRQEWVNWYKPRSSTAEDHYSYSHLKAQLGLKYTNEKFSSYVQGQFFQLFDLPSSGVGPGSVFYSTNGGDTHPGELVLRQAWVKYAEPKQYALHIGRQFYSNGSDLPNPNEQVENLKKQRIFNRVIGTFDYTGGRSFDAVRASYQNSAFGALSFGYMNPTQGGFSTEASIPIYDIDVFTLAYSILPEHLSENSDAQLFYYYYGDDRDTVKVDNRPLDIRQADSDSIQIHNVGFHGVQLFPGDGHTIHTLFWGILQAGEWGSQDLLAGSFTAETGVKFTELWSAPTFRVGVNYGSGDSNPNDGDHNTFFEMLPTPRQYALSVLFNQMNNEDIFIQVDASPMKGLTVLAALHYLSLANKHDLLYAGGGAAVEEGAFGYSGTAIAGTNLGWLPEVQVGYDLCKWANVTGYIGHMFPNSAFDNSVYGANITYAFMELNLKF